MFTELHREVRWPHWLRSMDLSAELPVLPQTLQTNCTQIAEGIWISGGIWVSGDVQNPPGCVLMWLSLAEPALGGGLGSPEVLWWVYST